MPHLAGLRTGPVVRPGVALGAPGRRDRRAQRARAHHRGPCRRVRVAAERGDAEPVRADVRGGRLQRAAAGVPEEPLQRDARAGSPRCRPPPASTRPRPSRSRRPAAWPATPSGSSPASPGAASTRRAASSTASRAAATRASARPTRARTAGSSVQRAGPQVLDRRVHRRLGHPDVHGRVAGDQPLRHHLGHQQGQPLDAAEQRVGADRRRPGAGRRCRWRACPASPRSARR